MKEVFNSFLIGMRKLVVWVTKAYLFHDVYYVYVVEAFITLTILKMYKSHEAYISTFEHVYKI